MSYVEFARAVTRLWADRPIAREALVILRRPASTHLLGRRIVEEYSQEGARPPAADFVAWRQTAGMGREQRSWTSPPGGVYATLVRPLPPAVVSQILPSLVAVALCETVNLDLDGRCRLKWPNDLLVDGLKLGGILIDVISRGDSGELAVISFGINHRRIDLPGTTSLEGEAAGRKPLADLTARLVEAVDAALTAGAPVSEVAARYRRLSLHRPGDVIRCRLGDDVVEGVFDGFDRHGFLRLRVGGEERLLTAGEVADGQDA